MHRRVRWENVLRAAGASLLVAVLVAWPRLAPPEPRLPGAEPAPLAAGEPPADPVPEARAGVRTPRRDRPMRRPRTHDGDRPGTKPRKRARKRRERASKEHPPPAPRERAAPERAPVVSGGAPPSGGTTPDPAQAEFGFENG